MHDFVQYWAVIWPLIKRVQYSQYPHWISLSPMNYPEITLTLLVSHYSAISNTTSCDALYGAIGFRGKLLLRYRPPRPVFGLRWATLTERSEGVAAIVCDTTEKTVRQGYCYTCLAIGGGGYCGRVAKLTLSGLHVGIVLELISGCNG